MKGSLSPVKTLEIPIIQCLPPLLCPLGTVFIPPL